MTDPLSVETFKRIRRYWLGFVCIGFVVAMVGGYYWLNGGGPAAPATTIGGCIFSVLAARQYRRVDNIIENTLAQRE